MSVTVILYPPARPDVLKYSHGFRGGATSVGHWCYGGHYFTHGINDNEPQTAERPSYSEHVLMGNTQPSGVLQLVGHGNTNKGFDITMGAVWTASSGGTRAFVGINPGAAFTAGGDAPRPFIGFFHRLTLGPNWYAATGEDVGPSSTVVDTGIPVGIGATAVPWIFRIRRVLTGPVIFSLGGVDVTSIATSIPNLNLRTVIGQNNNGTGTFRVYGWSQYGTP